MSAYTDLIELIEERVYSNVTGDITGDILQTVLTAITDFANDRGLDPSEVVKIVDGVIPISNPLSFEIAGVPAFTIDIEPDGLKTKWYNEDTSAYEEIDVISGQFRTKQILPVMSDYACYSDDGGTQSGTVTAGNDELIDIIKIIGSDYFAVDNSVITVQNLPTGYYALIEVIVELNLTKTGGTGLEAGVEIARLRGITTANYYNAFKLSGDYQIVTKMFTFNILNGDQITFNIKNFDASDFNFQILNFYSRMNIVATEPNI